MKSKSGKPRRPTRTRQGRAAFGLPARTSVVAESTFTSPAGRRYRILRTTEQDPYDPPRGGTRGR